jgi:hypothetical protein
MTEPKKDSTENITMHDAEGRPTKDKSEAVTVEVSVTDPDGGFQHHYMVKKDLA